MFVRLEPARRAHAALYLGSLLLERLPRQAVEGQLAGRRGCACFEGVELAASIAHAPVLGLEALRANQPVCVAVLCLVDLRAIGETPLEESAHELAAIEDRGSLVPGGFHFLTVGHLDPLYNPRSRDPPRDGSST